MRFPGLLSAARVNDWLHGAGWVAVTVILGLLPVWGGALLRSIQSDAVGWTTYVDHGEFVIYASGLLAVAILVVFRDYEVRFGERLPWGIVVILLLLLCVFVFAGASRVDSPAGMDDVNRTLVRVLSAILYLASLACVFLLTVLNRTLEQQELLESIRGRRMAKLEEGLARLEVTDAGP